MRKKVLGYLFYVFGVFFTLSVIGNLMRFFVKRDFGPDVGTFETIFAILFAGFIAYVFFKYAVKWTKKKPKIEIEDIGRT